MGKAKQSAAFEIIPLEGGKKRVRLSGDWNNAGIGAIDKPLRNLEASSTARALIVDLTDIAAFDTSGAWLIRRLQAATQKAGGTVEIIHGDAAKLELLAAMPLTLPKAANGKGPPRSLFEKLFTPIGSQAYKLGSDVLQALYILGSAVRGAQMKLGRGSGLSPAAIVTQLDNMGVKAVPIIMLMSFLIGAIIAQQGAFQLRYFGAELLVVDLVGILQLREIGVLLTAIMVAGRSGSAITAEIGSMKMHEEIDALKVMGLNPVGVLIFPRLISLVIILPFLTILANFSALAGAATVANFYSGITIQVFLERLQSAIDMSTIISGMLKAPFMALIIGIVASVEGLKVGGSSESLGRNVTSSVVKSIFVVIFVDGLFAMFYAAIDF